MLVLASVLRLSLNLTYNGRKLRLPALFDLALFIKRVRYMSHYGTVHNLSDDEFVKCVVHEDG
jgi:hypothetical protein